MEIKKVSIIGLGALGILYGYHLAERMSCNNLRIIADNDRITRYQKEQVYCNGKPCEFYYVSPDETVEPADLLIFAVKYQGLNDAIQSARNHVGANTIIISLLNGITSEAIIGQAYGIDKLLYCTAQGMDAVKVSNQMTYDHMGTLSIGELEKGLVSPRLEAVAEFFKQVGIPHEIDLNMPKQLWGKLMLNVGVNQTVAVYGGGYGVVQQNGPARDTMIAAMREVIALSRSEKVNLTNDDLNYWLGVLAGLSPDGKPSMLQDVEAKRYSEVELFAGTIIALGKKYGIPTPVNQELYNKIKLLESQY